MRCRGFGYGTILLLTVITVALSVPSLAVAEDQQQTPNMAGVVVDAEGVLRMQVVRDPGGQMTRERIAAAKASLDPKVAAFSKLRKISLNRLEAVIRERQGAPHRRDALPGRPAAGPLRVLLSRDEDIVLAGPAEGWVADLAGRVVGITSGRPVVQLQDLVVALRAFPPGKDGAQLIGCSIDPDAGGPGRHAAVPARASARPGQPGRYASTSSAGCATASGCRTVSINGVSPKTHFAQVMVEADYRMKLIGIGLETPPVQLVSYVERASPAQVSRNALQRWFFVPDYQCVRAERGRPGHGTGRRRREAGRRGRGGHRRRAAEGGRAAPTRPARRS